MNNFNYIKLKNTLVLHHLYLPLSKRLMTFIAYDGDLYIWALARWQEGSQIYHAYQWYNIK